jgi:hypothetical protein
MERNLLVVIGDKTYWSAHEWPRTAGLTANAKTGQLIYEQWSKDEDDHYREHKPSSHHVSSLLKALCRKTPATSGGGWVSGI